MIRRAAAVLLAGVLPVAAHAELWSVDGSISSRLESNDNPSLSINPSSGNVKSLYLSTGFRASRQMENWATGVIGALTGVKQGGGQQDRVDGSLGLTQSLRSELNTYALAATFAQDFNNLVQTADVTVGQGQRRALSASASWEHALTERLSTVSQLALDRTRFGQQLTRAVDFGNGSISTGLSYRLSEIDTTSVTARYSDYRAADRSSRSTTNSVDMGFTRTLTEDTSASLSLGLYRTRSSSQVTGIVCPLPEQFCRLGLVSYVFVVIPIETSGQGLQYSASYGLRFDEVSRFSFSAGSQQSPSGAGTVVRSDTLSATANRNFSEKLVGSAAYAWSRSRFPGGREVAQPRQQSLALSLSRQLAADVSLAASYQHTQSEVAGSATSARSNSVSISLSYQWPTILVTR